MNLSSQIEAVLFWKAEPVTFKELAGLLNSDMETTKTGLLELENTLKGRGLTLIQTDDEVTLGTSKEMSGLIEQLTKEELIKSLSKASLKTLSIVLYQGPVSRTEIDYIRGVNSQFILRELLIRGLVERVENPNDARSFLYKPTIDLLSQMGIEGLDKLPEYEQIRKDIEGYKDLKDNQDASN